MFNLDPASYQYFLIKAAAEGKTDKDMRRLLKKAASFLNDYSRIESELPSSSQLSESGQDIFTGLPKNMENLKETFKHLFSETVTSYLSNARRFKEMPVKCFSDETKNILKKMFIASVALGGEN